MIDVQQQLAATTREVGTVRRDDRDAKVVVARRTYPSPVEDVWDALTSPDRLPRWFQPVSGDLRLGGRFQVEGNAGGQVVTCDPPRSFEITWEMNDDASWVVLTLTPQGSDRVELAPWPMQVPQLHVEAEGRLVAAQSYGGREELAASSTQSARLRWELLPGPARS